MRKVEVRKVSFGISLDKSVYDAFTVLAASDRRSMAFLIRDACDEYLARRRGDGSAGGDLVEKINQPGAPDVDLKTVQRMMSLRDHILKASERLESWRSKSVEEAPKGERRTRAEQLADRSKRLAHT
jgi:hypothetical protein